MSTTDPSAALSAARDDLHEALACALGWNWEPEPESHVPGSGVLVDDVLDEFLPKIAAALAPAFAEARAEGAREALEQAALHFETKHTSDDPDPWYWIDSADEVRLLLRDLAATQGEADRDE